MESIFAVFFDRLKLASPSIYSAIAASLVGLNAAIGSGFITLPNSTMQIVTLVLSSAVMAVLNPRTKRHMSQIVIKSHRDHDD